MQETKKEAIIGKIWKEPDFSSTMVHFLKKACEEGCIGQMEDMIKVWEKCLLDGAGILSASLFYVTRPDEEQLAGIREFLCREYKKKDVQLEMAAAPELMGGFVLKTGDVEYDYSLKGQLERLFQTARQIGVITMSTISSQEIISIIKGEIEDYDAHAGQVNETGSVIWVGDGIAIVYGIDHAMYGEIVIFENGVKGMVQDIRKNEIGCILFGKDTGITEGTKVTRTKKKAGVPVGAAFLGRVVNALGETIDGMGPAKEEDYLPVEQEAPGIAERKSVGVPMETGILAIDSMSLSTGTGSELSSVTVRP